MDRLDQLESQSIFIFREAFNRIENIAMLWSLGKELQRDDLAGAKSVFRPCTFSGYAC